MIRNEPLLTAAFIGSFVIALLNLLLVFGVPLNDEQVQAIQALVGIAAPVVIGLIARRYVFGPVTVEHERRERHGH